MPSGKPLDELTIVLIEAMTAAGYTSAAIGAELGLRAQVAARWASRYREREGLALSPASARYRPVSVSEQQMRELARMVAENASAANIAREIGLSLDVTYRLCAKVRADPGLKSGGARRTHSGHLLPEEISEIQCLALSGMRVLEISAQTGISQKSVARVAGRAWREAGMENPGQKRLLTAEQIKEIEDLVSQGVSEQAIATRMGISASCVNGRSQAYRRRENISRAESKARFWTTQQEKETIRDLIRSHAQVEDIASKLNLNVRTVHSHGRSIMAELRRAGELCSCRRPIYHDGPCVIYTPEQRLERLRARQRKYNLRRNRRVPAIEVTPSDFLAIRSDALFARISAQVPRYLDSALRDDIIMDVYQSILEEELDGRRAAEGAGEEGDLLEQDAISAVQGSAEFGRGHIRGRQGDDARPPAGG